MIFSGFILKIVVKKNPKNTRGRCRCSKLTSPTVFQILRKLPEFDIAAARSSSHGEFLWLTGPTLPLLGEDPPPDEACAVRPSVSTNSSLSVHYHLIISKGPLRCRRQPSLTELNINRELNINQVHKTFS